ncbi:unnamed protein product [Acanthoscelides obtectus]|uniref:Protein sleepless n=1 Tax=Acanthoscelides obtectus TaxID=200917 RepID=A0A9P0JKT6_ACAOB|nr:unnamed protein product [Acanthoscelides obtectus]CAK1639719.1 hypothetical protein AOBTE_LOCUS11329 [Acanthoscelides obtectus]
MGKLSVLFALVAIITVASALKCYTCRGTQCDSSSNWVKTDCGAGGVQPYTGHVHACMKHTFRDRVSQHEMVSRKCLQAQKIGNEIVQKCPESDGQTVKCDICQTELCNSASKISVGAMAFTGTIITFLFSRLV